MNKHFKMTALAIVVSFGLTGCLTSNDSPADVKPATPIAKEEQGKPQTKPEESKPTTKPEEPKFESGKMISVDSKGNKWRIVKMNGDDASPSSLVTHYKTEISSPRVKDYDGILKNTGLINSTKEFDLDKLSNGTLGVHSGSFINKDLSGHAFEGNINEVGGLVYEIDRAHDKKVNYLFVNQPYSSYGMLYTNENEIIAFSQGLDAGDEKPVTAFTPDNGTFKVYKEELEPGQKISRIIWNDNIKGNATYTGRVIAAVSTDPLWGATGNQPPKVDGTITLNAQFGDSWDKTYISNGELNSYTLGKIALPYANIVAAGTYNNTDIRAESKLTSGAFEGDYEAHFKGKDLNDVIGRIGLSRSSENSNKGDVLIYEAVFGGTKQSK